MGSLQLGVLLSSSQGGWLQGTNILCMLVEKSTVRTEEFAMGRKKEEIGERKVVLYCTLQMPQEGDFLRASRAGPTCKEFLRRVSSPVSSAQE